MAIDAKTAKRLSKFVTAAGYTPTSGNDMSAEPDAINIRAIYDDVTAYEDFTGTKPDTQAVVDAFPAYQWVNTCGHTPGAPVRDGVAWPIGKENGTYTLVVESMLDRRRRKQLNFAKPVRDYEIFGAGEYYARRDREDAQRKKRLSTRTTSIGVPDPHMAKAFGVESPFTANTPWEVNN